MVPKGDMCEKLKEQKEALQESLSLTFTEHNGVVAAYTNVRNTVEWLLSKQTLQETIMVPKEKLLVYHYIASYAVVLRLVTRSSPRTSAQRTGHFRSLAVSLCFKRTNPLFC